MHSSEVQFAIDVGIGQDIFQGVRLVSGKGINAINVSDTQRDCREAIINHNIKSRYQLNTPVNIQH
jgi:hypothetical protein